MSAMSSEYLEFRLDFNDGHKLYLQYDVGSFNMTVITSDSQYGDREFVFGDGHILQLRDWLAEVDRRMHGEDDS